MLFQLYLKKRNIMVLQILDTNQLLMGKSILFEANMLTFQDLYGQRLEFDIISKIRETKKFSGVEELKKYINLDVKSAKEIFKLK